MTLEIRSSRPIPLRLTETAESDLAEIWSYLAAEASEEIASRFVTGLTGRFADVQQFPHMGAARERLASGLWVLIHDKYAIYYLPRPEEIVIVRVLHGSRDVSVLAERGELLS